MSKPNVAALARKLHARLPALTPEDIAHELTRELGKLVTPSRVREALSAQSDSPGPRKRAPQTERVHLTLDAAIVARARAAAARDGTTLAEHLEGCFLACETEDSNAKSPATR